MANRVGSLVCIALGVFVIFLLTSTGRREETTQPDLGQALEEMVATAKPSRSVKQPPATPSPPDEESQTESPPRRTRPPKRTAPPPTPSPPEDTPSPPEPTPSPPEPTPSPTPRPSPRPRPTPSPPTEAPAPPAPAPTFKRRPRVQQACLNKLKVDYEVGIFTMVIGDDPGYIQAANKLYTSAKRHTRIGVSFVILELKEKPLAQETRGKLEEQGWQICIVNRLPPPDEEATFKHFRDQFTKFQLWRMDFTTILYFDADTYVVGDITSLLHTNLGGKAIGATRDYLDKKWRDTFNMGVFLIHPNEEAHSELMQYYKGEKPLQYSKHWSEQGFLNSLYRGRWKDIGFIHNANLAVYHFEPEYWKEREPNIRVVHYTMRKPWKNCKKAKDYFAICQWWLNEY